MKRIIITGKAISGKMLFAKDYVSNYKDTEIAYIDGRSLKTKCPFQDVYKETKIIIIDDLKKVGVLNRFYNNQLIVKKANGEIFYLSPEVVIFIFSKKIQFINLPKENSFLRRYNCIEINHFNPPPGLLF